MEKITNKVFGGERPLFEIHNVELDHVRITFGESGIKECSNIVCRNCYFEGKYPLWHVKGSDIRNCYFAPGSRSAIWYSDDMHMEDCVINGPKFFREIISGMHEISSLFLFSRQHPVCNLEPDEVYLTKNYIKSLIYKLKENTHRYRRETVMSLLRTMIYDLSNVIYRIMQDNEKKSTRADRIFSEFLLLVENNYRTQRRVGWYALNLGITPKYLSEMVKVASRRTPNDWIDDYVTLELRVLLRNTNKNIKEITEEMNFPNQSFLGKYFKEHVGISPSAYRKGK